MTVPIPVVTFITSAPFTLSVPPYTSVQPLPVVVFTNDSAVAVNVQIGIKNAYIPAFSSTRVDLDGTELKLTVTPTAAPPAPGTFSATFYTAGDLANGVVDLQRAGQYIPPVRLGLVFDTAGPPNPPTKTYGPFYVGDYEDTVFSFVGTGQADGAGNGNAWIITFAWFLDAAATQQIGITIAYESPGSLPTTMSVGTFNTIRFADKISNLGPYLVITAGLGVDTHGTNGAYTLSVTARRAIGSADSALSQTPTFTNDITVTPAMGFARQAIRVPIHAHMLNVSWLVTGGGVATWRIVIASFNSTAGSTTQFAVDQTIGNSGVAQISIPGQWSTMTLLGDAAVNTGFIVAATPAFT